MTDDNATPGVSEAVVAHTSAQFEFQCLQTVLNSLDALVYVSDMQTHDLLFVSQYGLKVWGDPSGKKCFQYLQSGQSEPCNFCTNSKLVNENNEPNDVQVWEFQNTVTQRWYQCRDQAIRWIDGRLVRLEIAIDISDRKQFELQLGKAKMEAEAARAEAEELARVDVLTKVYNRRAFFEHMERLYGYVQRKPRPLCLAMLDIDYFKRLNDTYGHAFGDTALIAVCKCIRESIREFDQLFRIGGEEFAITLMDCDETAAFDLVERLRRCIEAMTLYANDVEVKLTCSFGIAEHRPGLSVDALLAEADTAMYLAKQGGRNRTCLFSRMSPAV